MNPRPAHDTPQITRFDAAAIADARGLAAAPASLLLETGPAGPKVLAVGTPEVVSAHPAAAYAQTTGLPHSILVPGLVNAHTHLDLTHIGPQPHDPDAGFVAWVDLIRAHRHADDESIAAAVRRGVELSLAGGVVAVGDIAGAPKATPNLTPWRSLRDSPLLGVSFLEFFGMGRSRESQPARLARILDQAAAGAPVSSDTLRLGLQPHAPTTVDLRLYHWTITESLCRALPLSTHLAETPEERAFIAAASGPQREFLERIGLWDDSILDHVGQGQHPVAHLAGALDRAPFLVAHVNDATDEAIQILARTGSSVAYCPHASAYFAAERRFGPHRYRDMLAAGVNVCLGTDSIVNLPADAADPGRGGLSTLREMRLLYRRDGTDPLTLLAMATTHGARALGLDPDRFLFKPGASPAGIVAVDLPPRAPDPLTALLTTDAPPRLLSSG